MSTPTTPFTVDFNAVVSAALTEAVNGQITSIIQHHANVMGGLSAKLLTQQAEIDRIKTVVGQLDTQAAPALDARAVWALVSDKVDNHLSNKIADVMLNHVYGESDFADAVMEVLDDCDMSDRIRSALRDVSFTTTVD